MTEELESIGSATMTPDGTIHLLLRAEGPEGIRGDASFSYEKSNPEYQEIFDHIGGIKVGEKKPVPPWP